MTLPQTGKQGDKDYWYDNRDRLEPEQIFKLAGGCTVKLDRRVPGDGTKWYVADLIEGVWSYEDNSIEPGDLRGAPRY